MNRYYTRACNFYYGNKSKFLVNKKKSISLHQTKEISFDQIEIITRKSREVISINQIKQLPKKLKKKINADIKKIKSKKLNFSNFNFKKIPNILGVLNLTPDSFSDGGKFNKKNKGIKHALEMIRAGSKLIDIGGESTRPGSKTVNPKNEWNRIYKILRSVCKKIPVSLDTRKSEIMEKGIKLGVKIINDVSGLRYDKKTLDVLTKHQIPFVIQHSKGTPEDMQKKYKLPALGGPNSLTKQAIFGLNSARIYGLSMNEAKNMPILPAFSEDKIAGLAAQFRESGGGPSNKRFGYVRKA